MKIASPDISHKSDVGGVILGLKTEAEVEKAFTTMMENVKAACPAASIEGVTLQRMVDKYDYELIIGSKKDPVFGRLSCSAPAVLKPNSKKMWL